MTSQYPNAQTDPSRVEGQVIPRQSIRDLPSPRKEPTERLYAFLESVETWAYSDNSSLSSGERVRTSLEREFHRERGKLRKLYTRFLQNVQSGVFWQFTAGKRQSLVQRLTRLRNRLERLVSRLGWAAVGGALAMSLVAGPAHAEFTLTEQPTLNPLAGFQHYASPVPVFVDIDGDGDQDAFVGTAYEGGGTLSFWENQGGTFVSQPDLNPLTDVISDNYAPRATFFDIDGDGDLDALVGTHTNYFGPPVYGPYSSIRLFQNNDPYYGTEPNFIPSFSEYSSPVAGNLGAYSYGIPSIAFVDVDGDTNIDALVGVREGGRYGYGNIRYYKNIPGNVPPFVQQETSPVQVETYYTVPTLALADLDGDTDLDVFVGANEYVDYPYYGYQGRVLFFRNDVNVDGTFAQPGAIENPLGDVQTDDGYWYVPAVAFANIDGDSDLDAFVGAHVHDDSNYYGKILYFENAPVSGSAGTVTPTLTVAVTTPAANALAQPGEEFSSESSNAVTAEIRMSLVAGDDPVTSIDLNSIVFPTPVDFDANSIPTNVVVETTTATAAWSVAAGPSLTAGALDIALVAGSTEGAEILDTDAPAGTPLPIVTLTYNTVVTVPLAEGNTHADLGLFGFTGAAGNAGDLGSVTISADSAFANGGNPSAAESTASVIVDIIDVVKGDVSGDGDIAADDAQQTLVAVAGATLLDEPSDLGPDDFGVQSVTPAWDAMKGRLLDALGTTIGANAPTSSLNLYSAFAVADVDEDGVIDNDGENTITGITSLDAANMLRFSVGLISDFGPGSLEPLFLTAPGLLASNPSEMFRVSSTSSRPGAQVTVSLDLVDVRDLYAGELRFDYDTTALRPVDVRIESSNGAPLIAHSTRSDDLGIAWASATPIENGVLHAVFEAAPGVSGTVPASVRARRLVLNRTRIDTGFEHRFLIEPYQFQLMANYPNPFNPETWIPFELAEDADVTIRIYGMDGTRVRTLDLGRQPQGVYASRGRAAHWNGVNDQGERVASGVYIYEIAAGADHATRRMVIMK